MSPNNLWQDEQRAYLVILAMLLVFSIVYSVYASIQVAELQRKIEELNLHMSELISAKRALESENKDLKSKLEIATASIKSLCEQLSNARYELNRAKSEPSKVKQELEELNSKIKEHMLSYELLYNILHPKLYLLTPNAINVSSLNVKLEANVYSIQLKMGNLLNEPVRDSFADMVLGKGKRPPRLDDFLG